MGKEVRKAFVARNADFCILSADYSQIELRLMTEFSNETNMLNAFKNGLDIHTATAASVYNIAIEQVTSEHRRKAKMVNFGLIYGISVFGLTQRLNIPRAEAKLLMDNYFDTYPKIKLFMEQIVEKARINGYVETILGRRRYLKDINSANATLRGYAERNAINAPIQGSSADLIKMAMIDIQKTMKNEKMKSQMTLQVHDELVFDTHRSEVEQLKKIVVDGMQNAIKLNVPIVAEVGVGENWLEAH